MAMRVAFREAPYIGPLVRNQLDADKDNCAILVTPPGVEIHHLGRRYLVPWANVKSMELV